MSQRGGVMWHTVYGGHEGKGEVSRNHGCIADQDYGVTVPDGALCTDACRGRKEGLRDHHDRRQQGQLCLGHHLTGTITEPTEFNFWPSLAVHACTHMVAREGTPFQPHEPSKPCLYPVSAVERLELRLNMC